MSWGLAQRGSPSMHVALAILSPWWSTLPVGWVLESPGLNFPAQQHYSLASTISITLSHQMPLSATRWWFWHHFLPQNVKEDNSALSNMPKGYMMSGMSQMCPMWLHFMLSHLLYSTSHIHWWYPASLQFIYFCCKIHCCEVCVCKIRWLQLVNWYY